MTRSSALTTPPECGARSASTYGCSDSHLEERFLFHFPSSFDLENIIAVAAWHPDEHLLRLHLLRNHRLLERVAVDGDRIAHLLAALRGLLPVLRLEAAGVLGERLLEVELVREGAVGVHALLPLDVQASERAVHGRARNVLRELAREPRHPRLAAEQVDLLRLPGLQRRGEIGLLEHPAHLLGSERHLVLDAVTEVHDDVPRAVLDRGLHRVGAVHVHELHVEAGREGAERPEGGLVEPVVALAAHALLDAVVARPDHDQRPAPGRLGRRSGRGPRRLLLPQRPPDRPRLLAARGPEQIGAADGAPVEAAAIEADRTRHAELRHAWLPSDAPRQRAPSRTVCAASRRAP